MLAGARTDESGGFEAQLGSTSELCKVLLRVIGLASAPAARRSDVSTIEATVIDALVHQLQLREVGCNRDDCTSADSAHGGHGAGRCIRLGAERAASFCYTVVGVDAHLGALILMLLGTATTNLDRSFTHSLRTVCPQAAPATPGDGPAVWTARRPCVTLAEKLEAAEIEPNSRVSGVS